MTAADLVNTLVVALRIAEQLGLREARTITALIEQVSAVNATADTLTATDQRTARDKE